MKLDENKLYSIENGRITCGNMGCSGMRAHEPGQAIEMTDADKKEWLTFGLGPMCCESCGCEK